MMLQPQGPQQSLRAVNRLVLDFVLLHYRITALHLHLLACVAFCCTDYRSGRVCMYVCMYVCTEVPFKNIAPPPPPGQKVLAFFTAFLHNTVLIHRLPNMDFSEFLTNYILPLTTLLQPFLPFIFRIILFHNLLYDHRVPPVPPDCFDYPDRFDYFNYYYYHLFP